MCGIYVLVNKQLVQVLLKPIIAHNWYMLVNEKKITNTNTVRDTKSRQNNQRIYFSSAGNHKSACRLNSLPYDKFKRMRHKDSFTPCFTFIHWPWVRVLCFSRIYSLSLELHTNYRSFQLQTESFLYSHPTVRAYRDTKKQNKQTKKGISMTGRFIRLSKS